MSSGEFKCSVCKKEFKKFRYYKDHVMKSHVQMNGDKTPDKTDTQKPMFTCQYCSSSFSTKYALNRHVKTYCKSKQSVSACKPALHLLQVTPETIAAITEIIKASMLGTVTGSHNANSYNTIQTDNSTNSVDVDNSLTQNNTNHNNLTINQDIKINPLGKENLDHITKEDKLEILRLGAGAVPALARAILELPENRNIAGYDKKNMKVMFVNRKGNIEIGNMDKVIGWFTEDNIGRVNTYITEYDDEFSPNNRLLHRLKVMQGHETIEGDDEEEHNRIYQSYFATCNSHVKDAIEVNSRSALQKLKKFRDLLEQQKTFGAISN